MADAAAGVTVAVAGKSRRSLLEPIVMAVTVAMIGLFSVTIDRFATFGNLSVILSNSTSLLILSCGMLVVIISRGLDLSQVAAMVAGATTFSTLINAGLAGPAAILAAVAAMALVGLANGWLIAFVEIPPMLATLASAMLVTGLFRFAVLRGEYLLILPKTNPAVVFFNSDIVPGVTAPVALTAAALGATWLLLHATTAGRVIFGMGDNFQTARLVGLPVRRTTILVYIYAALTALLAGLVIASASGTVDFRIVTNGSLLFDVILVVVLGGVPLRGGRGGVRNLLIGAALIAVFRNGMTLYDVTTQSQDMLKGVVLMAAILVDHVLNPRDTETDTIGDL
jgi:ribose transport system permease protein